MIDSLKDSPQPPVYTTRKVGWTLFLFGALAFAVFVAWIVCLALGVVDMNKKSAVPMAAVWVIGVPTFFFVEHVFIYRRWGDPKQFDQFKRLQDQAAKVWAGGIVVLAALFTGEL